MNRGPPAPSPGMWIDPRTTRMSVGSSSETIQVLVSRKKSLVSTTMILVSSVIGNLLGIHYRTCAGCAQQLVNVHKKAQAFNCRAAIPLGESADWRRCPIFDEGEQN